MTPILFLARRLKNRPEASGRDDLIVRSWRNDSDIEPWLALHHGSFPAPRPDKRQWTEADLRRDLLSRPMWRADWMWFAQPTDEAPPIGMISLLARPDDPPDRVHVHWLAVDPEWRRRGVARQLLVTAEQAAWDAGRCEIVLETLAAWKEAVAFYEASGYRPAK